MIDDFFRKLMDESHSNETDFEELPADNITDNLEENAELLAEEIREDFIALVDSFMDLGDLIGEAIIDSNEHEESPFEVPVIGYLDGNEGNSLDMDIRGALEEDERVIAPLDSSTFLESGMGKLDYNSAVDASTEHILAEDKSPGSQSPFEDISTKSTQGPSNPFLKCLTFDHVEPTVQDINTRQEMFSEDRPTPNPFSKEPSQVKGGIFAADESDSPGGKHITNYMDDPSNPYSNTLSLEPIPESKMRLTELRNQSEMNFYNNLTHHYEKEIQANVEHYKNEAEKDLIRGDDPRDNVARLKIWSK